MARSKIIEPADWWRDSVIYQVYLRSFFDSNGDGVGDLAGLLEKLPYLEELGVDVLWLSPVHPSPNLDWGYDVADYRGVDPSLGTLADLEAVIKQAKRHRIKVLLDLVPNHTSTRHPWFTDHRDWYIWADPKPGGGRPNNWRSSFGGHAWTLDRPSGSYYLHNFLPQQADLNWANPAVEREFERIMSYWLNKGAAGFRIDVVNMLAKDPHLRNNPKAHRGDSLDLRLLRQRPIFSGNGAAVHTVLRRWRKLANSYPQHRLLLGETWVYSAAELAAYYGHNDELQLGFNFPFWQAPFKAERLSAIVAETEAALPTGAWPAWAVSNHDIARAASRWAKGNESKIRLILLMLLTLRGTPVLYYGEELGLTQTKLRRWQYQDPFGKRFWPLYHGRDGARTPMVWDASPDGGFSTGRPWLPLGSRQRNVADQQAVADSTLHFTRRLIGLRRGSTDLRHGDYHLLAQESGLWAYQRGHSTIVVLNMSRRAQSFQSQSAELIYSTTNRYAITGTSWQLAPWEGLILQLT